MPIRMQKSQHLDTDKQVANIVKKEHGFGLRITGGTDDQHIPDDSGIFISKIIVDEDVNSGMKEGDRILSASSDFEGQSKSRENDLLECGGIIPATSETDGLRSERCVTYSNEIIEIENETSAVFQAQESPLEEAIGSFSGQEVFSDGVLQTDSSLTTHFVDNEQEETENSERKGGDEKSRIHIITDVFETSNPLFSSVTRIFDPNDRDLHMIDGLIRGTHEDTNFDVSLTHETLVTGAKNARTPETEIAADIYSVDASKLTLGSLNKELCYLNEPSSTHRESSAVLGIEEKSLNQILPDIQRGTKVLSDDMACRDRHILHTESLSFPAVEDLTKQKYHTPMGIEKDLQNEGVNEVIVDNRVSEGLLSGIKYLSTEMEDKVNEISLNYDGISENDILLLDAPKTIIEAENLPRKIAGNNVSNGGVIEKSNVDMNMVEILSEVKDVIGEWVEENKPEIADAIENADKEKSDVDTLELFSGIKDIIEEFDEKNEREIANTIGNFDKEENYIDTVELFSEIKDVEELIEENKPEIVGVIENADKEESNLHNFAEIASEGSAKEVSKKNESNICFNVDCAVVEPNDAAQPSSAFVSEGADESKVLNLDETSMNTHFQADVNSGFSDCSAELIEDVTTKYMWLKHSESDAEHDVQLKSNLSADFSLILPSEMENLTFDYDHSSKSFSEEDTQDSIVLSNNAKIGEKFSSASVIDSNCNVKDSDDVLYLHTKGCFPSNELDVDRRAEIESFVDNYDTEGQITNDVQLYADLDADALIDFNQNQPNIDRNEVDVSTGSQQSEECVKFLEELIESVLINSENSMSERVSCILDSADISSIRSEKKNAESLNDLMVSIDFINENEMRAIESLNDTHVSETPFVDSSALLEQQSGDSQVTVEKTEGNEKDMFTLIAAQTVLSVDDVPKTPKRPYSILDPTSPSALAEVLFVTVGIFAISVGAYATYRFVRRN